MELLVVGYDIFCEFYVVHKEFKSLMGTVGIRVWGYGSVVLAGVWEGGSPCPSQSTINISFKKPTHNGTGAYSVLGGRGGMEYY